jgi:predicted RNA binding protein YcfA (HicA-like mRNA interferase family)
MKLKELMHLLNKAGYKVIRAQKHWVLFNGTNTITVPRHTEVNRHLARKILKSANIAA